MMRLLPKKVRLWLFGRGYQRLYPVDKYGEVADTWKTVDQCLAEADLWDRCGFPDTARVLRDAVARDQAWS